MQQYQLERLWKQNYLLVNVISEGYDQKRFLEFMVKQKNTTPNVDYFSRDELRECVKNFKDEMDNGGDMQRSMSILETSSARLFDEAIQRRRSSSVMRRRNTSVADDTELSRNMGSLCVVSSVNQYITSKIGGYVKEQSQMVTIDTFPMKWRVKRLDSDFQILRDYLLRSYPQSVIPPLPT